MRWFAAEKLEEKGISARVVNLSTIKPIDKELLFKCARETRQIVTVEDHNIYGGLGSAVAEVLSEQCLAPLKILGVCDTFGESGEPDELASRYRIDAVSIEKMVLEVLH